MIEDTVSNYVRIIDPEHSETSHSDWSPGNSKSFHDRKKLLSLLDCPSPGPYLKVSLV